nr:hypothetical protein [Mycobacterium uberis]
MTTSARTHRWAKIQDQRHSTANPRRNDRSISDQDFTAATMANVMAGSGASISYHFGGQTQAVSDNVGVHGRHCRRHDAVKGPVRPSGDRPGGWVFEVHVRAYLEAMWKNRRLVRILSSGNTPAGFEIAHRGCMMAAFCSWMDESGAGHVATQATAEPRADGDHGESNTDGGCMRQPGQCTDDHQHHN